jgi:hypothetical protein
MIAGSLRPDKQVNDSANTTTGAILIVPATSRGANAIQTINITSAICKSGVVRSYVSNTGALRFDLDITDAAVSTPGTVIYFVAGPGAGQRTTVLSYNAAIQTATVATSSLTNIVAGQSIYSVGQPMADGFVANSSVTSGRAGTFAGVFHIPNAMFAVGSRLFRLTDSSNNNIQEATSTAELSYTADGMSVTAQQVSISSRYLDLRRAGPRSESFTVNDTSVNGFNIQYVDPLAETFLVDSVIFRDGVFVTSLDLCFGGVPSDDIPVIVELRPVVNGYPSANEILPCVSGKGLATVTKQPDQVAVSQIPDFSNPATVTTFTFDSPVYLLPGQQYAIVVRSDSDQYMVYTAELGGSVIGSNAKVGKQPYAGSFFKSQNASTWTESPFEDLMFRLNKALWTANTTSPMSGVIVAQGVAPTSNLSFDSVEFYPHDVNFSDVTSTRFQVDILPMNLTTFDLTGQVAVRYDVIPNTWGPLQNRSMVQGYGGSDAANNVGGRVFPFSGPSIDAANTMAVLMTLATKSPDVAPYVDLKKINALCVQHNINNMGLGSADIVIQNAGAGYLANLQSGTVTTSSGNVTVVGSSTTFQTKIDVGDTVIIGGNVSVIVATVTDNTHFDCVTAPAVSRAANDYWTYGVMGGNNTVAMTIAGTGSGATGYAVINRAGTVNNVIITATGSGYITTPTITVTAPAVPGGDFTMTQTTALMTVNGELQPTYGNALTRYIQKSIPLADGFEARDLVVYFDAYRPIGSHFYVYYKVLPTDADASRFDDQSWRLMTMATDDSTVSTNYNQFKEFNFVTTNSRALDQSTDTTDKFKVFAFKIVMAGSSTTDVPRIKNFRGIALDE